MKYLTMGKVHFVKSTIRILFFAGFFFLSACKPTGVDSNLIPQPEPEPNISFQKLNITEITSSSMSVSFELTFPFFTIVSDHGLVYTDLNNLPTIQDVKISQGSSFGSNLTTFEINNLEPESKYYFRAYAESDGQFFYSNVIEESTK